MDVTATTAGPGTRTGRAGGTAPSPSWTGAGPSASSGSRPATVSAVRAPRPRATPSDLGAGAGTLVLDAVGRPGFHHARERGVLDRMIRSLDVSAGAPADERLVAAYLGCGDVFRVRADRREGGPADVLPAPVPGADVRGVAFPFGPAQAGRLTWFDRAGNVLGSR